MDNSMKSAVRDRALGLLLVSPSDYQSAVQKGVASLLADFDEGGFFRRVLIAFPLSRTSCIVDVSENVRVRDIGTDWLAFAGRYRWLRRLAAPLHFGRVFCILIDYVRRHGINVIRATDPCFSGPIAWLIARLTGRPFCVSIHADLEKRHALGGASAGATILGSRPLARTVERLVISHADMVLPIRESLRGYALASGAHPDRIRIIPHGTDLSAFVKRTSIDVSNLFDIPCGHKIVSFVGRLVKENYVDDVLEVTLRVAADRTDFTLVVIGGGPEAERLQSFVAADARLRNVVRFGGFQPRHVVAAVRQASAVSLCLMGGFSLIEACAAGSPVVAYDVEWHGELVRDGETGFLVPEHDLERLEAAVRHLLNHPPLVSVLGRAAQALALSRHDLETTRQTKRQCYLDAIRTFAAAESRDGRPQWRALQ